MPTHKAIPLLLAFLAPACFAPAPVGEVGAALETDDLLVSGTATFLGDAQFGTDFSDTLTIGAAWDNDLLFVGDGFPRTISLLPPPPGNNGANLTVKSANGANATGSTAAGIGGDFILGGALGGAGDSTHAPKPGARTIIRGGPAGTLGSFGGEAFGGDVLLDAGVGAGREEHDGFTGIDGAVKIGTQTGRIVLIGRQAITVDTNGHMFQAHGPVTLNSEQDDRGTNFWTVSNGTLRLEPRDGLLLYGPFLEVPIQTTAPTTPSGGKGRFYLLDDAGTVRLFVKLPGNVVKEIPLN